MDPFPGVGREVIGRQVELLSPDWLTQVEWRRWSWADLLYGHSPYHQTEIENFKVDPTTTLHPPSSRAELVKRCSKLSPQLSSRSCSGED